MRRRMPSRRFARTSRGCRIREHARLPQLGAVDARAQADAARRRRQRPASPARPEPSGSACGRCSAGSNAPRTTPPTCRSYTRITDSWPRAVCELETAQTEFARASNDGESRETLLGMQEVALRQGRIDAVAAFLDRAQSVPGRGLRRRGCSRCVGTWRRPGAVPSERVTFFVRMRCAGRRSNRDPARASLREHGPIVAPASALPVQADRLTGRTVAIRRRDWSCPRRATARQTARRPSRCDRNVKQR